MVAIVSGNGLGLSNSSLNQLGKRGVQGNASFGQARIEDYINIADGNLVIRQQGYNLAAIGQDIQSVQTYNSKGLLNNNAQWSGEWSRRLSLVGNLNEAGSKIIVTAEDGHEVTFNFSSANNYISKEGDGAYDKLAISGTTWTVTDGKTLARESYTYDAVKKTGRLTSIQDNNGTNLVYSYDSADRLISIKDSTGLNELIYQYDGTSNRIKRIDTKVGGAISQNVYYEYDTANRLTKVISDLTPADNLITDQKVYTTTYAYDGSSSRIASITQSDGSSVQFGYELDTVNNVYRVKTVKDSQGTTTFSYAANKTTVTNGLQEVWEYSYDANQQLTSIKNANAEVSNFTYDVDGNVLTITDNESNKLTYRYDSNGNLTEEYGPTGKAIKYSYTNNTQLATVTEYLTLAVKDASGNWVLPTTGETKSTQYLYDAQRLRFVISAEGAVVEYIYNDKGQLISKGGNYQAKYASTMTYTAVDTWVKKQLKKELSSYEYDVYGNLKKEIHYSSIDATADATTGVIKNLGIVDDAAELIDYVYDARGLLLQKITRRGADRATAGTTAASSVQSFAYDGMGRVLSEVGSTGTTSYSYGSSKITVTNAAGLSTVQSFDSYGRLTSTVQNATNLPDRTTSYLYNEAGRLIYSKQPSGYEQFNFYDKKGRLTGVVDSSGLLTEYVYNKNDLQTKEIRYATAVSSAGWLANGVVSKKRVEEIRPAVAGLDRVVEKSYDSSSRLISVKQANGLVTEYSYDSYGNITQTKAGDRISRYFYNKDNLQVAALDAEGYLVETVYNSAGQKIQVNRHSKVTTESLRATGTLAQLKPTGTDNTVLSSFYFYDAQGQLIGTVDEKKFVTAYLYNQKTNSVTTRQYALATTATVASTSVWTDIIKLPAGNTYQDSIKSYDLQGRLIKVVDPRQGTTSYVYDEAGRLIKETLAASTANERVAYTRYNAFGEVTQVLRGEAANQLTTGMTADLVEQTYNQYAIKSFYDAAGRKTQVMSAAGQLTTFYYDKAGRLTHQINAEGNVVETGYSLFGEVASSTQYSKSLTTTATDLAGAAVPSALANAVGIGKSLKGGELTTTFSSLVTAIKDATKDRIEKLEYDKLGKVSKKTDGLSNSIASVYNLYGELEQQTQQVTLGTTKTTLQSSYAYSKRGELKSTILDSTGLKNTTLKQYDAYGRVITETDANGNVTRLDYSQDQGRTIQVTSADNGVTKTTYDAWGRQLSVSVNGNLTSYTYNDQAKTLTVKSPEGLQTTTQYNEFGDVVQVTQANQGKSTYLYNDDGQKTKETNAVAAITNYVYDKKTGLLSESTDAVGVKTSYYYDNANRIISQIVTLSATESQETSYSYDGLGQRLEVTEAKGSANERVTQYGYDKAGNLISVTQDAKGLKLVTSYEYDETGRQVKVTDKGLTTVYTYDALGRRISEVKDPTGLALKVEYRYDANGNVTRKIDEAGNSSWYVYNAMNQLVYTINSLGIVSGSVYDLNGKVIAQYQFTALQDISSWTTKDIVTAANVTVSKTTANLTRFVYNKDRLEIYRIDAEGAVVETQYNELGKVAHAIQYDKVVNLTGEALTADTIKTALTTAEASAQTQSYYYDALGRIVYSMNAAGYVTRNVYNALNQIIQVWDFRIATTLARNSTFAQINAVYAVSPPAYFIHYMYYDKLGRKIYDLDKNSVLTRYSYDELGNLTSKKETAILYTSLLDLLKTKDAAGNLSARPPANIENYDAGLALLTDAQYRETNYYYDKVGRIAYQIDALGNVTRYNTNAAGQITNTVKYTTALAAPLSRSSTLADLNTLYLSSTPPAYTVTGTFYDAIGRKVVDFNEMNLVTHYSYDALGNVVSQKVTTVTVGELLDLLRTKDANGVYTSARPATTLANSNAAILLLPATKMQETKYFYDKAGRRSHDVDALGYVTAYSYNAQGQQTSVKQTALNSDAILDLLRTKDTAGNFSVPRPALTADNLDKGIKLLAATNYRETSSYYDKDGRLGYQIDAQGYVTRYSYDAFDNITSTARFNAATSLSRSSTLAQLDTSYKTATTLPEHALTQYGYDALNRKVKETDAQGNTVETGYDAFNNVIWVKDKLGNKGYFAYDGLNRNTVKIDPEGYVTIYTYDVFGNQVTERKFLSPANQIDKTFDANGLYTGIKTLTSSTEVAPTTQPYWNVGVVYADITYQYDKLNRKTVIKDASGAYEAYTYTDGSAQPATYRNKLGGVYNYSYDKLGRLIKEILPEPSAGNPVTHLYEYDAYGNKTKQVEASGLTEQRVSVYQYDNLNRLTAKIAEAVGTVQLQVKDATKPYLKGKVEVASTVAQESYQYDGYGNPILKIEANGAKTFSYYDKNARKIAEVNPLGGLTRWEYNAAGLVTKLQSYETLVSLPTQAGGAVPTTPSGNVRVVEYGYDKVGRQTSVLSPNIASYEYDSQGKGALITQSAIEKTYYDANGNIIRVEDGKGNSSYSYYDKAGRKILAIDQEGYATSWSYGNDTTTQLSILTEIKYAKKLSRAVTVTDTFKDLSDLLVKAKDAGNDRTTVSTYDKLGRVIQTELLNVSYSDNGVLKTANSVTYFSYNALDKLLTKKENAGETLNITYDKLGRESVRTFGSYTDSKGVTFKQRISSVYNGLGLLSSSAVLGSNDTVSTDDRVTQYSYDKLGRLTQETDASLKHSVNYGYDLMGNRTWTSNSRKANDGITKYDETLIEYNLMGKEITRQTNEGSLPTGAASISWKTLEERETRYNAFGEITGKRLVKTDSTTKSTDSWQEVTEYNNQGKVWKSNANNGVTRYYLYDRNGNATLQLDSTGTGITAKSADQLKDLTGVSYTETVYDKRNQVVEVREPKFNQDKLDTSLNLFGQTVSRTVDKSTVSLTDSASKLSFNADTQKLSIQANAQAKRVMIKYWPKGSTATASNTLTVDMQATTTAGQFVLDIGAIKANIDYSYSYSSSDATGKVLDSGTGAIKRSVSVVDVFSGGSVTANPAATATGNSVANTMGAVAVDVFNNYKLPITVIGNKAQKITGRTEKYQRNGELNQASINYDEGINVKKIQFALPSTLKGFGDGNFEVELSIDGQVYKKSVAAGSSLVEIALDNNTDKFLGGKNYSFKIYKRTSATTTELVMNTTNKITDKVALNYLGYSCWNNLPPMYYSKIGDLFEFEEQTVNQEGSLNNYSQLMMKNIPTGTSRVEVKYKVAGASQWSTLTSSAALYNNTAGWYKAGLNTLENNTLYDYQYLAYNAKGEILGGGQGVINTALNQATVTQKTLASTDLPSVYIDKQETVNTKQDVEKGLFVAPSDDSGSVSLNGSGYSPLTASDPIRLKYNFNNEILKKYGNNFVLIFKNSSDGYTKTLQNFAINADTASTDFYIDLTVEDFVKLKSDSEFTDQRHIDYFDVKLALVEDNQFLEIGIMRQQVVSQIINHPFTPWGREGIPTRIIGIPTDNHTYNYMDLGGGSYLKVNNQGADAKKVLLYYRELGSVEPYKVSSANPLKDVYSQEISGNFQLDLRDIDPLKKYEFQYVSFNKDYIVINRQQGVLEQNAQGAKVTTTPLNYGGDGFILFSGTDIQFIDQFKPVTSASTSAKLKIRKVGTAVWEQFALTGTSDWFSWNGNQGRDGEYEFQLDSFNGTTQTTPSGSIIGKLRLGSQPKVLSYIPKSFAQNQITLAGQPTGSSKVTVKYGTAAGQLNKTAVLTVGSDGKAILDATDLAEQNLLGSTTVYYSYETTDANGKLLNRATGYVNVGVGAGSGQHTNQLNDSWLDFQPAQNNGSKMELFYRKRQVDASGNFVSDLVSADINSDAYWASSNQFQKVSLTPSNGIYRWNLNDLVPKSGFENYEYFYQLYDSAGKVIAFVPGKLSIDSKGNGSSQQNKWVINGSGDRASQIVKSQAYNAFGEIISETDGNGNTSSLSYNTMGKLTKKVLPTVDIRKSDGTVVQGTPTLEYGYDLSGRLLTSKDANGNINKQSYLNGRNLETGDWLVEKETHADTGEVSNLYDVYGNLIEQSNALGIKTGYSYDINGNLIQITRAARTTGTVGATHITDTAGKQASLIDTFTYDELGNRLSATNALKNTTTTDYDALGRVVQSKTAEGVTTKVDYVYDASISNLNSSKGGIKRTETDGLGKTLVDEQDYFGRTIKHTDKGEHVFTYTYNAGGWLTKQINSQGQSLDYNYYSNGAIKEIRDTALNLLTSYRYDDNGNRIEERYQELNGKVGEPRVFQNALINYDSLNRKISVQDQSFNIHYEYDGNGNIVHMLANYRDAVNAAPKIQDFWYSYDSMNRFTISMGVLNSTKIERGNTGIAISYDKLGQRLTADYGKDALNSTKAHKESYSYTTDGYLETVKNADYSSTGILGTQYTVSTRYNDALGRVTQYTDNNENSATVYQTTTTIYSKDNQITEQKKEGGTGAGTTKYTYLADKATLDKTVMTPTSGSIQTTQYAYEWWDSAKQSKITTTVDGLKGETSLSYNINGHLSGFVDDKNAQNKRAATYINNSQGMVLQRNELINNTMNRYRNFYYVNGQRVGDLSNDGPSREDYVQNLQSNRATATQAKDFKPISSADFDQNFEPINAQYPSSASTSYVVNNGDTLQSIALSVWGDASMWYMLADVNGLSATDKLTAGQVLTVPNKVTNIHNNSETFRPYNPGEAIGNTQPTVPSPPPPPKPKKKCGGIAQIVMIVVAVVATIFTAGAALSVIAPGMSLFAGGLSVLAGTSSLGITGSMALAAGAAAVGSAASQLAGKAMGVVDSFSWSQVGISALTAAATAGVGGALAPAAGTAGATATQSSWVSTAKTAINNGGWVAKGAVYGTVNYGSTYLANQVFGNNQSFNWAALGSSIVGSIVAAGMGAKEVFDGLGKAASPYASSLVSANAVAVIDDKWFGGAKPDYLNVSMAAITSATVRQFGENSSSSQYKSNITVYNPATGERTALDETQALYTFDIDGTIDKVKRRVEAGIDYMNERIDDARELFYDYMPNNSQERQALMLAPLSTIVVKAEKEDSSVLKLFQERVQALEDWARASVPFQYSWATPTINTGNPRLDRYYFQPINNAFNTVLNAGWNTLKLAGNTAAIVSNLPAAGFSIISGDYEASQQFYEDLYLSNPVTAPIGGVRSGLRYLGDVREFNKATVIGRTIGANQRGSASLGLLNDIPVGSTTGEVLTASMPAPPIKAVYPSTASTQVKAPFLTDANSKLVYGQGHLFEPIIPKLSTFEDRVKVTPINNGVWTGERGNSNFIFDDPDIQVILPNGIEYKNGYADFSPVALHTVRSPSIISGKRTDNFRLADELLAERLGVTPKEISKFRSEQFYTWHEKEDMRTFEFVPSFLHTGKVNQMDFGVKYGHLGGFSEVKKLK